MPPVKTDGSEVKSNETLAQHKERVAAAAQEHARAQTSAAKANSDRPTFPASPSTQSSIPEFMQDKGIVAPIKAPEPTTPAPVGQTQVRVEGQLTNDEPEWQKVARERGWKTPADAINSYMNLEREFHSRMNQQRQPIPAYTPPPPPYQPAPPLAPWQQPMQQVAPVNVVQQLARRHGISLEDAERLVPLVAEVSQAAAEMAAQQERARYDPVVIDLQKKVSRSEEQMEIANDPAMRVPRVQYEVNKILSENPSVFDYEHRPLRWALDRALRVIAQDLVRADPTLQSPIPGYPSQPPVTAGQPTGTRDASPRVGENVDLAGNYFKLKTAQEKKDFLVSMGVASE